MKMRPVCWGVCLFAATVAVAVPARGQKSESEKPAISMSPLSDEQIAVYKAALAQSFDPEMAVVHLAELTEPADANDAMGGDAECAKGLEIEAPGKLIHRFTLADVSKFGLKQEIVLVDPKRGRADVEKNDPGKAIRAGKSVDEAVHNGFAHGLFSLSEIVFDKQHKHAIVSYSFICGGLCGNGASLLLVLEKGEWRVSGSGCSHWIS